MLLGNLEKHMKTSTEESILYFDDFYSYNQTEFNIVVKTFSKMRNFHHHPDRNYPIVAFTNEIAKAVNTSLILKPFNYSNLCFEKFPTLISLLSDNNSENKRPLYFWQLFKNSSCT